MPQAMAKILVHMVFSTKDRRPLLRDAAIRREMHHYLAGILSHRDCLPVIVGGVADHQKTPYREEFLTLLNRYQIPYDEHSLWD